MSELRPGHTVTRTGRFSGSWLCRLLRLCEASTLEHLDLVNTGPMRIAHAHDSGRRRLATGRTTRA